MRGSEYWLCGGRSRARAAEARELGRFVMVCLPSARKDDLPCDAADTICDCKARAGGSSCFIAILFVRITPFIYRDGLRRYIQTAYQLFRKAWRDKDH